MKEDRVQKLIALCVKNKMSPQKNAFAGFIHKVASGTFMVTKATAKSYIHTLIEAWRLDKWKSLVSSNQYLLREEKQKWINSHQV